MTDLGRIASAMGGEVHGNVASFPTPGHSAKDRGSWAYANPDAPDGVWIESANGGNPLAIKDELRAKGALPARQTQGDGWRISGTYEFKDEAGAVLYRTRRHERPGQPKRYTAERSDGRGGWIKGLSSDVRRVLYRLPELLAADPAEPVYLVEGERKADKLAAWGFTATAIAFGCTGWRKCYAEPLAGRTVVILPDNDEPGRGFAETARAAIEGAGGRVHLIELPDLPPKGDVVDWTGTAEELRALSDKALAGKLLPLPTLDLAELAGHRAEAKRFAIERIAPEGEVTLFTGPGSGGKSLLGQQLATVAAGAAGQCLGLGVQPGPAIYLTCEDDAKQLHWRQEHLCAALGVGMASLAGKLHLVSLRGALDNDLGTFTPEGTLEPAPAYHRLLAMIQATGSRLVFLDNVAHLFTGNENDRGQVTRFVNLLNRLAEQTGAAIVLLGHPNKSGDSYSGSTAWLNAVRSQATIDHERDGDGTIRDADARVLSVGKANYARKGEAVRFRWHEWAYVRDSDLPKDQRAELAATIQANADNDIFLACLRVRIGQERAVSENPASRTYAPLVFAKMDESKDIGRERLEAAMDRLFRIEAIERGFLWRSDRKDRFGLRERCADVRADPALTGRADVRRDGAPTAPTHTLYTTYKPGAAFGAAAPDPEDIDWGDNGECDE